jgi:hypothetical protein
VIYNTERPDEHLLDQYQKQKAEFVEIDVNDAWWGNRKIYSAQMLDISGGIVRHDSKRLASLIREINSP